MTGPQDRVAFIWSVADLLRGDYKQSEYGRVILPLVVLRRLDCVLEPTKPAVLAAHEKHAGRIANLDPILRRAAGGLHVYNTSPLDFRRLLDDPTNVRGNLQRYIAHFSPGVNEVMERFAFHEQIVRLDNAELLYLVVAKFADIDLHPDTVSNRGADSALLRAVQRDRGRALHAARGDPADGRPAVRRGRSVARPDRRHQDPL